MCVPVGTVAEPVPPLPTWVATSAPSTRRSNLPPSVAGRSSFLTMIVPVLRVLVIVQVIVSPSPTATLSVVEPLATSVPYASVQDVDVE